MSDHDILYTPQEVAERLRISPQQVYELTRVGRLGCYCFGLGKKKRKAIRCSEEHIRQYLAASEQNGERPATFEVPEAENREPVQVRPWPQNLRYIRQPS